MRTSVALVFLAIGCLALSGRADDAKDKKTDDPPTIQELNTKGLRSKLPRNPVTKPFVIRDGKELAKVFADEADQAALGKQADLDKQFLLLFSWSGSGQDMLAHQERDGKVVFKYTRGLTRDLRYHVKLYALKKGASWAVEMNR